MNTGIFGEGFPYSNFHDLNMDWIIKIAKDFLDQYTHLQETITNGEESLSNLTTEGLEQLQEQADALEALLEQWYDTHSQDIQNELTQAIASFTTTAYNIAQETIRSIPTNYTELYNIANNIRGTLNNIFNPEDIKVTKAYNISTDNQRYASGITYTVDKTTGKVTATGTAVYDAWIHLYPAGTIRVPETGMYFLYGCPSGGSDNTYRLIIDDTADDVHLVDYGKGACGYLTSDKTYRVVFIVTRNQTVDHLEFTPSLLKLTPDLMKQYNSKDMNSSNFNNIQYWNNNTQIENTYYTRSSNRIILNSSTGYRTNKILIPKGHIIYRNLSGAFTFIYDLTTHTYKNLNADYGKSQYLHNSYIELEHDSIMFATSNDNYQPQIVNGNGFPKDYKYGTFDETYIIISASGNYDFTKLKTGLDYAYDYPVNNVIVNDGNFNLITEFGTDYFTNLTSQDAYSGLKMGHGTHIIFRSKTKVECHYTGTNQYVCRLFSPFNFVGDNEGYYIEGLNLECSRVRYAIHDEGNNTAIPYKNIIENCQVALDNSNNEFWANPLTIGGGLGQCADIIIKDSYFKTEQIGNQSPMKCVNYHNAAGSGSKSRVHVLNCYFETPATIGLSYYGSSTEITVMDISSCSLPLAPYVNREGSATIENVMIREYCNEIR